MKQCMGERGCPDIGRNVIRGAIAGGVSVILSVGGYETVVLGAAGGQPVVVAAGLALIGGGAVSGVVALYYGAQVAYGIGICLSCEYRCWQFR